MMLMQALDDDHDEVFMIRQILHRPIFSDS